MADSGSLLTHFRRSGTEYQTYRMDMTRSTARLTVQRGNAATPATLQDFEVPYRNGMSVLDALIWVRSNVDPSLAIRYSCTNANSCKECLVRIDGKTVYACTYRLSKDGVTVYPLGNKPLVADLVTDIIPPKEKLSNLLP